MRWATRHQLPDLGVGIGLRREFYDELLASDRGPDWLEIIPENFVTFGGRPRRVLAAASERWDLVSHGVALNIGGPDALDDDYVERLAKLTRQVDAPFFSDHLCYSRLKGVYLHDLLPLPFSEAVVEHVVPRIQEVTARVGRPFLLENPSYYATMPGQTLDEASFLTEVLERADCGLLLDVNNVFVNATNHGYDARQFIDALPLDRVVQLHLAGHERGPERIIDTHGAAVSDEVWELYRYTVARTGRVSTLIEWDQDIPSLGAVLDEADRARQILDAVGHENRDRSGLGAENRDRSGLGSENRDRSGLGSENRDRSGLGGENRDRSGLGGENRDRSGLGGEAGRSTGFGRGPGR